MNIQEILNKVSIPSDTCEYWDIRVESTIRTDIKYIDFELNQCTINPTLGAFIRIFHQGMWYYSSTTELNSLSDQVINLAKKAALFSINNSKPNNESGNKPYNTKAYQQDLILSQNVRCDKISLSDKQALCQSYFPIIKEFNTIKKSRIFYTDTYLVKYFRSSASVQYSYDFNQCGLSISYSIIDQNDRFDGGKSFYGKEFDQLRNNQEKLRAEILESSTFINAPTIKAGEYPLILDSITVGIFAHESFGHKSEADFMLGDEQAKEIWKIGSRVGNDLLSIVDDGNEVGTGGYCPFDDEGFPAQKTYLIKNGILTGRLHSQQTACELNESPTGNGRAINFMYEPIVRMTNTYIERGSISFNDLLAKVDLGIFIKDIKHGSGLSTFTIAPEKSYMIRHGKIAEPVKVTVISGDVMKTLHLIDGCSSEFELKSSTFGGCGKGEQFPLPVGTGGSKVLIRNMQVS